MTHKEPSNATANTERQHANQVHSPDTLHDVGPRGAETADRHLIKRVPTTCLENTVGAVLTGLPGSHYEYTESIYVLDKVGRLVGTVPLPALLSATHDAPLSTIITPPPASAHAKTDQEKVASIAIHHGMTAVPVVDKDGKFLGVVPPLALMDVLRHEHIEDLHRLAGIRRETAQSRRAMEAPPLRRARDRLPWLLVGLGGSVLATFVMARFEAELQSDIAIAFFIPGIVYLADAIGTQTEAIAVRGLSLSHAHLGHLLGGELRTGFLIGLVLALVTFPIVWFAFGNPKLALGVALALLAAGTMATSVGFMFPWLLFRLGRDPAFGSGPIATIIQDVLSIVIYFLLVSSLLS